MPKGFTTSAGLFENVGGLGVALGASRLNPLASSARRKATAEYECSLDRPAVVSCLQPCPSAAATHGGLTSRTAIARAYDHPRRRFEKQRYKPSYHCPPHSGSRAGLKALGLWWQIQLDPDSRALDAAFLSAANAAIAEAERLAAAEPARAEAWFYVGAAYGVRAQFRVYRVERLAAARDGKRIKEALEKALALDPSLQTRSSRRPLPLLRRRGTGLSCPASPPATARRVAMLPRALERASLSAAGNPRRSAVPDSVRILVQHKSKKALALISRAAAAYPHTPVRQIEAEILDVYSTILPRSWPLER